MISADYFSSQLFYRSYISSPARLFVSIRLYFMKYISAKWIFFIPFRTIFSIWDEDVAKK